MNNAPVSRIMPTLSWALIGICALALVFLGGSSRPDAAQIVILRPLFALLLVPALYLLTLHQIATVRLPLLLLALLFVWMGIQVAPLPPSIWHSLPDRSAIQELDADVFGEDIWRPISMVPARGLNALAALIVPIAAALLVVALRFQTRELLIVVAALGIADGAMAFLQAFAGPTSGLFFYAITNTSAVGIFANENHSGAFSATAMLAAARLGLDQNWNAKAGWLRIFSIVTFVTSLLALVTNGSRAGVVVGLFGLACCVAMMYLMASPKAASSQQPRSKQRNSAAASKTERLLRLFDNPLRLATIGFISLLVLLALFILNDRAQGLEDLLQTDSFEDLRSRLVPVLQSMVSTHWLFGTGFGSFEEVYHIYEPTDLLFRSYVNQAHNDWAQYIIEGGLPALLLLLTALGWLIGQVLRFAKGSSKAMPKAIYWTGTFVILMAASVPDYPLRTPIFQAVGIWLALALALDTNQRHSVAQKRSTTRG